MLRYLFDTDHLTWFEEANPHVMSRFNLCQPDEVCTSAVNGYEALTGRVDRLKTSTLKPIQRIAAFAGLVNTMRILQQFLILQYDDRAESRFIGLHSLRVRTGAQDLRIASIALVHNLTLVTGNTQHFRLVPGLTIEDWSY